MLFDYFLDLWTSLEILVDFFRISSDRRDVSLENQANARWLLGKSGPACRRDARKHTVISSRWRAKRAPQGNPKSTKILNCRPKLVQSWCGVRLASSWLHFGSVLASAWLENHKNVVFYNMCLLLPRSFNSWPSQTHCILHPFWRLSGSCSRLAAYAFHVLWWPDLHENIVIYILFYYFLAPQIPLETLLTNPSLIRKITNTLYFITFLTTFGLLESSSSLCFPRTARTQPSRNHCNLHAVWLLSGPWIPFEILLTNPSLIRKIIKTVHFTPFLSIPTWSMDSVRKVVFVPLAFCSTSPSFR